MCPINFVAAQFFSLAAFGDLYLLYVFAPLLATCGRKQWCKNIFFSIFCAEGAEGNRVVTYLLWLIAPIALLINV